MNAPHRLVPAVVAVLTVARLMTPLAALAVGLREYQVPRHPVVVVVRRLDLADVEVTEAAAIGSRVPGLRIVVTGVARLLPGLERLISTPGWRPPPLARRRFAPSWCGRRSTAPARARTSPCGPDAKRSSRDSEDARSASPIECRGHRSGTLAARGSPGTAPRATPRSRCVAPPLAPAERVGDSEVAAHVGLEIRVDGCTPPRPATETFRTSMYCVPAM